MAYITNTILDQWTCLDPAEMFIAWLFAANSNLGITCTPTPDVAAIFLTVYGADWSWRYNLWQSQWNVHPTIDDECEAGPVYFKYSSIEWLPELLTPVANGDIHSTVSVRCREVRGFP